MVSNRESLEICYLPATELSGLIRRKEVSPVEVVEAHLARIEATEPTLNSFITLLPDQAMADAKTAENEIQSGNYRGPLHGIPITLKDLYYLKGVRNTSGSKIFHDFVPDFDSTITSKLKNAGTVILGKTNTHQFAYGITGENPDYGDMHNPWNPQRITGGSSGGSVSSVASGQSTLTMGSDTGGSIRVPSSLCGLVGLKPTYGRLSRYGLTALSWSQDHPGPMARTVADCAMLMNATAGYDPKDPATSQNSVPDYTGALTGGVKGLRVGVPKEFFEAPLDSEVERAVRQAINLLEQLGAVVKEISWPMYTYAAPIATVIQMAEATSYHADLVRSRGGEYAKPVRLLLEAGFFLSAPQLNRAHQARTLFVNQTLELLQDVDVLAGPMTPITAHKIGATEVTVGSTTMTPRAALTQYTRPYNLSGFPAISVPCGFSAEGMPIGLQLGARPFAEETLLRTAHVYEQATQWHQRRPSL